jgi:D-alanine-D-alanine ligase-like ATP-grasp enzyme
LTPLWHRKYCLPALDTYESGFDAAYLGVMQRVTKRTGRVAILCNLRRTGDPREAEFDTPESIAAMADCLAADYDVTVIEADRRMPRWIEALSHSPPDLVLNLAEGWSGAAREALYAAVLEHLGISYIGNDPTTLLITHNKALTNQIAESVGVHVPPWAICADAECQAAAALPLPVIVKPNSAGSSIGIGPKSVVTSVDGLACQISSVLSTQHDLALVQQYISNPLDVSMSYVEGLGEEIFGPMVYAHGDDAPFTWEAKQREYSQSILRGDWNFSADTILELHRTTRALVQALDMRGYGRADFRVASDGTPWFLEMNGQVEIRPSRSDFVQPIAAAGYSFAGLLKHLVSYALATGPRLPAQAGLRGSAATARPSLGSINVD